MVVQHIRVSVLSVSTENSASLVKLLVCMVNSNIAMKGHNYESFQYLSQNEDMPFMNNNFIYVSISIVMLFY